MRNFVIADLKLFNEEQMKKLGFQNFNEMNQMIIKTWNKTVLPEDKVIIMGDIGTGNFEEMKEIVSKLNGELYYTTEKGDRFSKEEWKEIGIHFIWKISMYKELENDEMILYCITPIRHIKVYEQNYRLIVVDNNNPIDGMIKGKMLSADAAKWYYSPINTDNLLEIYESMKEFEEMTDEEHRTDIKEVGEE